MAKMTKAIAVLGVVAGLGVAALPLSSHAVEPKTADLSVYANVAEAIDVSVTVDEDNATEQLTKLDLELPNGATDGIMKGSVRVSSSTSSGKGLTITMAAKDEDTSMHLLKEKVNPTDDDEVENDADKKAEIATFSASTGTNSWWAYKTSTMGDKAGIPAGNAGDAAAEIKKIEANGTASESVEFSAFANKTQKAGMYKGAVVFTATVNE